jgi:c-di-GMP-binding flagellar brake protein YcgR
MENKERRRYFRVDIEMIFAYKLISHEEKTKKCQLFGMGDTAHPDSHKLFMSLESDIQESIQKFGKDDPQTANLINLLNRKINLVSQGGPMPETQKTILDLPPRTVNLSACGVAFKESSPINIGQAVELEIVLLPEQTYILSYGEVVSSENKPLSHTYDGPKSHPYRISVDFHAISDEDVERIIQHIMRKESELLKARRHLQS